MWFRSRGPVGSSQLTQVVPLSPSIRNLKSHDTPDGSNGVDLKRRDVVRTTIAMVIHSVGRTRREPPEKTTKRGNHVHVDVRSSSSVSSSDLGQSDSEVPGGRVKLWCVLMIMEQRHSTCRAFGPRYSTGKEDGREMKGREGHFHLRK